MCRRDWWWSLHVWFTSHLVDIENAEKCKFWLTICSVLWRFMCLWPCIQLLLSAMLVVAAAVNLWRTQTGFLFNTIEKLFAAAISMQSRHKFWQAKIAAATASKQLWPLFWCKSIFLALLCDGAFFQPKGIDVVQWKCQSLVVRVQRDWARAHWKDDNLLLSA